MAQHVTQLQFLEQAHGLGVQGVHLALFNEAFLDEVKSGGHLVHSEFHFLTAVNPVAQGLDFLHLGLGGLLVLPEVGHMGAQFLFFDLDFLAIDIQIAFQVVLALL